MSHTVRPFTPADAPAIARLARVIYGDNYVHHSIYDPLEFSEENRTGLVRSLVVVDESGEVIAHYALEAGPNPLVAETGIAMVDPTHRGEGLMNLLSDSLEEAVAPLGLAGLYALAVTNHPYSQKVFESHGSHPTGLMLGVGRYGPTEVRSIALYFKYLQPVRARTLYAAAAHRKFLERVYAQFGTPVEWASTSGTTAPGPPLQAQIGSMGEREILVEEPAGVTEEALAEAVRAYATRDVPALFLDVPLERPGADRLAELACRHGFRLSAVRPYHYQGTDLLRLQMPLWPAEQLGAVVLESPLLKELSADEG